MEIEANPVEAVAWPLIEQCRREIAAAWGYVNAAREILVRSRALAALWTEQRRVAAANEEANLDAPNRSEAARIGMFVGVGLEARPRKRRHRNSRALPPSRRPPPAPARRTFGRG
jgi:hypothetical protein